MTSAWRHRAFTYGITIPFAIEGQNAKGLVQSGFATRRYPYATSIAPNVAASATMNIQMPSLREGI